MFKNLTNYVNYHYICDYNSYEKTGNIQFPKTRSNNISKLIVFGDWSKSIKGIETLNILKKKIQDNDVLLFLGDIAYDLNYLLGKVGNEFLSFAKEITSVIPFQVINIIKYTYVIY